MKLLRSLLFLSFLEMRKMMVVSQGEEEELAVKCTPTELFEFAKASELYSKNNEFVDFEYSLVPLIMNDKTGQFRIDEFSTGDAETIENGLAGLKFRMEYNGEAWLAIGRPQLEKVQMIGAHVIIGRPGDDSSSPNPSKYDLVTKSFSGVEQLAQDDQTLIDASITQTGATTVLEFTKRVAEDDFYNFHIDEPSTLVWAVGYGNPLSIHKLHGGFQIHPAAECIAWKSDIVPDKAPTVTEIGTEASSDVAFTGLNNNTKDPYYQYMDDAYYDTDDPYYQYMDDGYYNKDSPKDNDDPYYQYMDDGYYKQNLSKRPLMTTNQKLWIAHGVFATIAWAVCAPLAAMAAIFRYTNKGTDKAGPNRFWFKIHTILNTTCIVFTIIAVIIALVATDKTNSDHFDHPHNIVGLIIMIVVTIHALFAVFRPSTEIIGEESTNKNPKKRIVWEYSHRIFGILLLGASIFQLYTGFEQLEWHYEVSNRVIYFVLYGWMLILIMLNIFGCIKGYFYEG